MDVIRFILQIAENIALAILRLTVEAIRLCAQLVGNMIGQWWRSNQRKHDIPNRMQRQQVRPQANVPARGRQPRRRRRGPKSKAAYVQRTYR